MPLGRKYIKTWGSWAGIFYVFFPESQQDSHGVQTLVNIKECNFYFLLGILRFSWVSLTWSSSFNYLNSKCPRLDPSFFKVTIIFKKRFEKRVIENVILLAIIFVSVFTSLLRLHTAAKMRIFFYNNAYAQVQLLDNEMSLF